MHTKTASQVIESLLDWSKKKLENYADMTEENGDQTFPIFNLS